MHVYRAVCVYIYICIHLHKSSSSVWSCCLVEGVVVGLCDTKRILTRLSRGQNIFQFVSDLFWVFCSANPCHRVVLFSQLCFALLMLYSVWNAYSSWLDKRYRDNDMRNGAHRDEILPQHDGDNGANVSHACYWLDLPCINIAKLVHVTRGLAKGGA